VALTPAVLPALRQAGIQTVIESGAGQAAFWADADYTRQGGRLVATRAEVFAQADTIVQVRCLGANPQHAQADSALLRAGQTLIGFCEPLAAEFLRPLVERQVTLLALDLMPRTSKAQTMDALSSMATITGYKGVLLAASALPKLFPMLMTAAGTLAPARVFVIGAGVAGLQAIATARRLGAVVTAYDVRPAVKEEVQSVGAKFLELELGARVAEHPSGYALPLDDATRQRQQALMAHTVAEHDVVITTAAVPGKPAPILLTAGMVERMRPGSVVVDLAADRGGNCELTVPNETVEHRGVTILGPTNLPATVPSHASLTYSRNVLALLQYATKNGTWHWNDDDDILREVLVVRQGQVVHAKFKA
jgi:NAD(P) transhydrogenase subunit alpha